MDEKRFSELTFEKLTQMTDRELAATQQFANSVQQYNRTKNIDVAISAGVLISTGATGVAAKLTGAVLSAEIRAKLIGDGIELAWDVFDAVMENGKTEVDLSNERAEAVLKDVDFVLEHRLGHAPFSGAPSNGMLADYDGDTRNDGTGRMTIAQAQKLYQVQKSTGWLDKTPSERAGAIELANSMKPSAKTVANDPGGLGLGPGSRDGGNSLPSGRSDRDQQGGGSSGSSSNNNSNYGSPGRADRDQQGGTPNKTTGGGTTGGRADRDQQGGGSSGGGSSNKNHYDQVNKGNVRSGLPVALDLDGDGIEVSFFTNAAFDLDGDGYRERTTWVAPDDALLVNTLCCYLQSETVFAAHQSVGGHNGLYLVR